MTDARAAALRRAATSTVFLGLVVAILTWGVDFRYPMEGLDPSWGGGLYMAADDGLNWGSEVVFTYGPLGFLFEPINWFVGMASVAFLWNAVLHFALAIGVVWAVRRTAGPWAAVAMGFLALALLTSVDVPLALATLLGFAALRRDPPRHAVNLIVFAGAPFAAVEVLEKLSSGPPVLVILVLALVGARARPWQLAAFAGLFVATLLALWLGTGQPLGDLPEYVSNSRQVISGYSQAMSIAAGSDFGVVLGTLAAFVVMLALIAAAALSDQRDRLARICATLLMAAVAFSVFKEGVVRYDVGHLTIFFATALILWLALPWRRSLLPVGAAVAQSNNVGARQLLDRVNPVDHVRSAGTEWANLFQTGERETYRGYVHDLLGASYEVPETMLERIGDRTVSIDPAEISAAWALDLNWHPLPVFQNYTAYTAELDRLNADAVASEDGPEVILRRAAPGIVADQQSGTIDGRFIGWDPPAQALATLCHFETVETSPRWHLLERVRDRCGEPRPVGSVEAPYGETVDVPAPGPGEVIFARIHGAEVSGLEAVRSLLYKAKERRAIVNGERDYRFIPGTAEDGLLLRGSPRIVGLGPFAQAPQAETLELSGPGGDLRYDFYAMTVDTGERARPERGG